MRYLRAAVGYTRTGHQRNTEIRKKLKVSNINIKIQNNRNNWIQKIINTLTGLVILSTNK